jgi:hypothetical protein
MRPRFCLALLGLLSGACAAFGYDFGEYQAADGGAGTTGSSGESSMTDKALEPSMGIEPFGSGGGSSSTSMPSSAAHGGELDAPGGADDGSIFTTFGVGGAPVELPEPQSANGESGAASGGACGAGGEGGAATCEPRDCFDALAQCGGLDDGCGHQLDCGPCFWWFEQCVESHCVILLNP